MKRIAIDMDEVIADINEKHLRVFNSDYNESIVIEELMGTTLEDFRPEFKEEIMDYLYDPLWFRDLEVISDSQDIIKELSDQYEIFITTAAMEFPSSFKAKFEWLKENFPFISEMNFVAETKVLYKRITLLMIMHDTLNAFQVKVSCSPLRIIFMK